MVTDAEGNEIGKLFVGGLSQVTNDNSLRNYFSQLGDVEDSVVMMDNKTGRSRGFGYVKYKNPDSVSYILQAKPHQIDGKEVDVKQCNINMKGKNRRSLKIFVGGISLEHDSESIKRFFAQFGKVTDVNLMMDQTKNRHRGFAFLGFEDESVVKKLISMHFVSINNKQVEIKAMEPPNFGKKINTQTEIMPVTSTNANYNGLETCCSMPTASLISSNNQSQMWRTTSSVQYHSPTMWPTQLTAPLTGWVNSSQWIGANNDIPSQWNSHYDHGYWSTTTPPVNCYPVATPCQAGWCHQLVSPPPLWTAQSVNWPSLQIGNPTNAQMPKISTQSNPTLQTTIPPSTWNNSEDLMDDVSFQQSSSTNWNTSQDFISDHDQLNEMEINLEKKNYDLYAAHSNTEPLPAGDYSNWMFGADKEYINSNVIMQISSSDSSIPGSGEGDSFNISPISDTIFPYYATRN